MSIVETIQKKLFISSSKKALSVLDGAYKSVVNARSLDFDDIREYVRGDNAKDIAWKASSKSPKLLVKRHIADRQQPVLFMVDASVNMKAVLGDSTRVDVSNMIIASLGTVIMRNNEKWGCFYGDENNIHRLPFRGSLTHLEHTLVSVRDAVKTSKVSGNTVNMLNQMLKLKTPRSIIIVIAGLSRLTDEDILVIRKVTQQHDLLWVSVDDQNPFQVDVKETVTDVESLTSLPLFLRSNRSLKNSYETGKQALVEDFGTILANNRVSFVKISSQEEVVPNLTSLLQRRSREVR